METDFELLLCTDGHEHCQAGLSYGADLAAIMGVPVLLVGAFGKQPDSLVRGQLEEAAKNLQALGVVYRTQEMSSLLVEAVETTAARYRRGNLLTVYSTPQRSFLYNLLRQSSLERLMAETETPIIRLRAARWPIRRILVCSGGLPYTADLEALINFLAGAASAAARAETVTAPVHLTFLHVAEPDSDAYGFQESPENFLQSDSPQARHMQQALEGARAAGLEASLCLRRGVVVHEILAEVQSGNYDLVGLGSSHSAASRRHTYVPSVTAQVAIDVDIPVLVVRAREKGGESRE
jgi:nucleotide-binding universal stress UspA family protein